ncbi:MAG: hypothetical protein FJZ59_04920 [Chlamydiae bacterium]|nr:hypothetical protein [Chlamydiota bacterium]
MEIINKLISCSYSRNLIAASLQEYNVSKSRCSKFCYASGAVLTSLVLAPIEAIARFALALITSIFLLGHCLAKKKGLALTLASIPVRLLASAELSITTMIVSFMVPYNIFAKKPHTERAFFNVDGNSTSAMRQTLTLSANSLIHYRSSVV